MRPTPQRLVFITGAVAFCCGILWYFETIQVFHCMVYLNPEEEISPFEGFDNVTGVDEFLVPNIVHFIRFKKANFSFVDAVIVLAVFKNHKPDKIMFHADDVNFSGPYWEKIKNTPGMSYEIAKTTVPETIFGQKFSKDWHLWHAGDVTRIRILMKYGGIILDNDSYVVRSLDSFRKFEIAIGWDENQCIGTQVIEIGRAHV